MEEFIKELDNLGLSLKTKNGDLILSGRNGKLTPGEILNIKNNRQIPDFIKENKTALVRYLAGKKPDTNLHKHTLDRVSSIYQLSPLQEGILFHILYDNNTTAYITQFKLEFPEGLNIDAFRKSWDYVIKNHSILRTAFIYDKLSTPVQCVHRNVTLPFDIHDFSHLNEAERETHFNDLLQADRQKGFDLGQPPLTRITLVRTSTSGYKMIWTKHHILWDGWSGQVIINEVLTAYACYMESRVPLELREDLYEDYIQYLSSIDPYAEKKFWKDYMTGFENPSLLPFIQNINGRNRRGGIFKEVSLVLEKPFCKKINDYAQAHRITVNTIVQGVWAILLANYSRQDDVVFGATVSGRPADVKYDKKVGLYINTLPFRAQIKSNEKVADWLAELQKSHVRAREYQYTAIIDIQKWAGLKGDLFDSILVFRNYPLIQPATGRKPILPINNVHVEENNNYPLSIQASLQEQLTIDLKYNSSLLDIQYVEMIKGHFRRVLEQIAEGADIRLSDLDILTSEETRELLIDFNITASPNPSDLTIVDLFEAQAARTPHHVAAVFEDVELTYEELNERANQLGNYLHRCGVGGGTIVGICIERSLDMIVGLIGILKAGGAYIPIDPEYPADRIRYILSDSKISQVVTSERCLQLLPENANVKLVLPDRDQVAISRESKRNLSMKLSGAALAYVIYTSGSTGKPKGVMVEQSSLVNLLRSMTEKLQFTSDARLLSVTTFSFDIFYLELYMPLLKGAKVILASRASAMDGYLLRAMISAHQPSYMQATPATWQLLLDSGWQNHERVVIMSGGEAIKTGLKDALTKLSDQKVWNLFGPTETTIWSIIKALRPDEEVVIGKPIHNTKVYIVDEHMRLLPKGVKGELCIGGDGVGRGYLNKAELTQEKFVKDPFNDNSGSRLYKTGDLARWLPNGDIEYLDRKDNQVKIRGYRVELGEIENVLQESPWVSKNAVVAKEDASGIKRLIAYIVPQAGYTKEKIREYLESKLPDYMVPSLLMEVSEIPLTPNGKIDRKSLPDPGSLQPVIDAKALPRNPVELTLMTIWKNALSVTQLGIHDNFFELGGHSLLAMRVVAAVRKEMDIDLALKELFDRPSIAALANLLMKKSSGALLPSVTAKENRPDKLPLSFSQERLWFIDKLEGSRHFHMSSVLRLRGNLDKMLLEHVFQQIINRHEVLRTIIRDDQGVPYQQVTPKDLWRLDYHKPVVDDQSGLESLIKSEVYRPFDLANDSMLRAKLVNVSENEHVLILVMHHIASDGWSVSLFIKEFVELYSASNEGRQPVLPDLPVQYSDYAIWQREYLEGALLSGKMVYWREKLKGLASIDIPTDHPRPIQSENTGSTFNAVVDLEISSRLKALSQKEGATLFMTLLAAFKLALSRYSGAEDICVGTPIANRTQSETEALIGFFINTLPLRTSLDGDPTFLELLHRVKATTMDAYTHQEVPFEKVLDVIRPDRNLNRSPLFQVFFNMANQPRTSIALKDVEIEQMKFAERESKFDITLYVLETDQGMSLQCLYKTSLFNADTIATLMKQYVGLLEQIVSNPSVRLSKFDLLTGKEPARLHLEAAHCSYNVTVIDLVAACVGNNPEQIAIADASDAYTYKEVWELSSSLASLLQSHDVAPGDPVAVFCERNALLPLAMLGILKSGACFCVLSKASPQNQVLKHLGVVKPRLILDLDVRDQEIYTNGEAGLTEVKVIKLKTSKNWLKRYFSEYQSWQPPVLSSASTAYQIFTSGSTGAPKLVEACHGSLVNYVRWQQQEFALTSMDRFSMLSGLLHDPIMRDIFVPLSIGGTLCIPEQALIGSGGLFHWLNVQQITVANLTPSLAQTVITTSEGVLQFLRYVFYAGEPLKSNLVNALRTIAAKAVQINLYGATESQQALSYYRVAGNHAGGKHLPLGKGILNTELLVLRSLGEQAGVGELGEIAIRSPYIASGYKNDPSLTNRKFINNPTTDNALDRIYLTGDLGRYSTTGDILFEGRADRQVKIRGYRVELAEIEYVLLKHKDIVAEAVAEIRNTGNDNILVAYLVSQQGFNKKELRRRLEEELPAYMLPEHFIVIDRLPLTPNGKLDRKALPEIRDADIIKEEYVAPLTETEVALVEILQDVLGMERIGLADNFYELGGNSLQSVQVVARLKKQGLSLKVIQVLKTPVIGELAGYIQNTTAGMHALVDDTVHNSRSSENAGDITEIMELTGNQQRFFDGDTYTHAVGAFSIVLEKFNKEKWLNVLLAAYRDIDVLRMRVFKTDKGPRQMLIPLTDINPVVEFIEVDQPDDTGNVGKYLREARKIPFDLERGQGVRTYVCHNSDKAIAYIMIHHVLTDDISNRLLVKYLKEAYLGKNVEAPGRYGYRNFLASQNHFLKSETAVLQLQYWLDLLVKSSAHERAFFLPEAYAERKERKAVEYRFQIRDDRYYNMVRYCKTKNITVSSLILSWAFVTQYFSTAGICAFTINTVVDGRESELLGVDMESVIGQFTNLIPVTVSIDSQSTFKSICHCTHNAHLSARMHQQVPYAMIMRFFEDKTGKDLRQYVSGVVNYRDLTDNNIPPDDFNDTAEFGVVGRSSSHHYPWAIKCDTYKNGMLLTINEYNGEPNKLFSSGLSNQLIDMLMCNDERRVESLEMSGTMRTTIETLINKV
jgi:amino acid adenylation domain-containing protein